MDGYYGVALTRYYNSDCRCTDVVQQNMKLQPSSDGLFILGVDAVYPGTSQRHPTYSPDSFLFQISPDGQPVFVTCDLAGQCSPVTILD